jgi:phage antirepressor YoqD-like protein
MTNQLSTPQTGQPTISSLEIAKITGKEHAHVMRDIRSTLDEAGIDQSKFGSVYKGGNGQDRKCYQLPRRESDLVVSGYSVKYRLAIIDRWQELESKESKQSFESLNDPAAMRGILLSYTERLIAAEDTLKIQAPKVNFYDTVISSNTICQMSVAAQVAKLPYGRNILFQKLREDGVLISGGNRHNMPKQAYINSGLFTVEESAFQHPKTEEPIVKFTTHCTQKGIDWLIKKYGKTQEVTA